MTKREKKVLPKGGWGLDYMPAGNVLMPYRLLREHIIRYVFASQFVRDKVVLDVACGSGYGSSYLANKGARGVVGGDREPEAIAQAKQYYKKGGVEFVLLDATRMPIRDSSFDVIVSFETIEHVAEYEKFLGECRRVLRDNGHFICSTPNVQTPGVEKAVNPYHVNEFSGEQLCQLLNGYFQDTKLFGQSFITNKTGCLISEQRLANIIKTKLLRVPYIDKVIRFVTRFAFKEFRLVTLGEIDDFDSLWDENSKPVALENSLLAPANVIAVAHK
jgi:2-polyprenyl-3-methyl-5-hydroxy-6-metoxy-1,4-benzoquinol methylase